MLLVYSKTYCSYCVQAKSLLNQKNIPFKEIVIGEDITPEQFKTMYPDIKTVPAIFDKEKFVGGFQQLEGYLTEDKQQQLLLG